MVSFIIWKRGLDTGQETEEAIGHSGTVGHQENPSNSVAAMITNARVLEFAGVRRVLMRVVKTQQLSFLEHILRRNCLEKDVPFRRIEGGERGAGHE